MSRKKHADRPVEWKLSIPSSVAGAVDLELFDAVRGRPTYGARSALVTELLKEWLKSLEQNTGGEGQDGRK